MKDLITSIASILLLMVFVLQFSGNQVIHTRLFQADMAVETFRDTMKEDGCLTAENQTQVTQKLSHLCRCDEGEILVESRTGANPASRGSLLHYRIRFPLKPVVVMAAALGIGETENTAWIDQEGWVVSCYEESDDNAGDSGSDDDGASV